MELVLLVYAFMEVKLIIRTQVLFWQAMKRLVPLS